MQVTVVIPTYNAQSTIAATIDSVRAQTYGNWELIVVDGGSSDRTYEIAFEYSTRDERVYTLAMAGSMNSVDACNYGIGERSRSSRCVLVLDADDLLAPDALESLIGVLIDNREAVAVYGRFSLIDGAGHPLRSMAPDKFTNRRLHIAENGGVASLPPDAPLTFDALVLHNCIKSPGQMLIRSDALRKLGTFDPSAFPVDDWDMWVRLSLLGEIHMVDKVVLEYRVGSDESVMDDFEVVSGEIYFRRKLVHTLAGDDLHAVALAGWRQRERRLIGQHLRAAFKAAIAGRHKIARSEFGGYLRSSFAYLFHWGIWRAADHLPRHAGRRQVDSRTMAHA